MHPARKHLQCSVPWPAAAPGKAGGGGAAGGWGAAGAQRTGVGCGAQVAAPSYPPWQVRRGEQEVGRLGRPGGAAAEGQAS